jgi:UDP-GlcNAc:undecaprenyl-phosphate GlcNAc-1-phosphate transferase
MPDKRHIHHWLFEMAGSHRQAVLVMYMWSAMLAGAATVLGLVHGATGKAIGIGLGGILLVTILVVPRTLRRTGEWEDAELRERIHNLPPEIGPT